jgi:hypothetical protein
VKKLTVRCHLENIMPMFQIKLLSCGTRGVPFIKSLRLVSDLGLGEAHHLWKYLGDSAPCVLVAGVNREIADHAAALLREAGAEVVVEESTIEAPMLLCPEANQRYRWSWLVGPVHE